MEQVKDRANVLVTSISKKVPLLKSVKNALDMLDLGLLLYGADTDKNVIGFFFVDKFWKMPNLNDLDIEELITFCHANDIICIIPTRDGELKFFSYYKDLLREQGINVMVSHLRSVEICLDKLLFYNTLNNLGYPVIPTFSSINKSSSHFSSFVVKEQFGAGAKTMGLNLTKEEALNHSKLLEAPIIQPMIIGREVSVDLYIDKNRNTKGVICRTRDKIVDGESQITKTIHKPSLEKLCSDIADELKLYGHVIFQVIEDVKGHFYIIECNCRFGGASTLSIAAGLDSFYWFLLESLGENLDDYSFKRTSKELTMVRHPQDFIF